MAARKRSASPVAATELDTNRNWTLEEVESLLPPSNPKRKAGVRAMLLRSNPPTRRVALGQGYRTEDILPAVPRFVVSALVLIRRGGERAQRFRGFSIEHLWLLIEETRTLGELNVAYEQQARRSSTHQERLRAILKAKNGEGLAERREIAQLLRDHVLDPDSPHAAALEVAAAATTSPAGTAASMRAVADVLERVLEEADVEEREALDAIELTRASVQELRTAAKGLEDLSKSPPTLATAKDVDQAALDQQDGLVLALMRNIWRAFRKARDKDIVGGVPTISRALERLVISESRRGETAPEETVVDETADEDEADDEDATDEEKTTK